MEIKDYQRKIFSIQAVQVTLDNVPELAEWTQGLVLRDAANAEEFDKPVLQIRVFNPRPDQQSEAYIGDWITKSRSGFKIYPDGAFRSGFEEKEAV